jgi:hypothetical protein
MNSVLQFPRKTRRVTQADLAEERILKKRAILWSRLWEEKKRQIRECLLQGGEVEEGPLTAELDVRIH